MSELEEVLDRYFRFHPGEVDILPCCVRSRKKSRTQDDRRILARVMNDLGFRIGAEIGTARGESAEMWCQAMPGLNLTCIDPYVIYEQRGSQEKQESFYEQAKKVLAPFDVRFICESSRNVVDQIEDGSLDFINIDGDHLYDAIAMDLIQYVPHSVLPGRCGSRRRRIHGVPCD
jgi:predicted O-methyltransferase YrrM